jgi:replicative DNA helicase
VNPTQAPQNLDAEEMVLGAMLLTPKAIDRVTEEVHPDDFYRHSHGVIFRTIVGMHAAGAPVDALTLVAELEREQLLEAAGDRPRINELAAVVPAASNIGHYAKIVHDAARRRRIKTAAQRIELLAGSGEGTAEELATVAEHELQAAILTSSRGDFTHVSDAVGDVVVRIADAVESGNPLSGALTGFPDIDKLLTGLHPGQLVVVAARPGVGKSVFVQNIAENLADRGTPTALFSLEMSRSEIALRALCRKAQVDLNRLRTGSVSRTQLDSLRAIHQEMTGRPLYIEDNASLKPSELRTRARRLKSQHGLGLLVVDYLQLMISEESREKKNDEVAAISRSMKLLAKELHIPVILVSQLNRNLEYRQDKRPTLADLRDSGAIEQDADVVIFLYREETYKEVEPAESGKAEVIVAKNRMGSTETVKLLFLGRRQTFATPAPKEDDAPT